MSELLNQQNSCSSLFQKKSLSEPLREMLKMQDSLQKRLGIDFDTMSFMEKVNFIKVNWAFLTSEYVELLERLPYKNWKTYSEESKAGWISEEQKMETYYEFVDMLHFFLNFALALGLDHDTIVSLYVTKNEENFKRQERGY